MTVLYQYRERKKNPERNKDRFCGERSCCGTRLAIGQWCAPHAYKSRCDWLKGLAQQLEPRVCSCSASLGSSFHISCLRKHLRGTHVQVTAEIGSFYAAALWFCARWTLYFFASWLWGRWSDVSVLHPISSHLSLSLSLISLNQDLDWLHFPVLSPSSFYWFVSDCFTSCSLKSTRTFSSTGCLMRPMNLCLSVFIVPSKAPRKDMPGRGQWGGC